MCLCDRQVGTVDRKATGTDCLIVTQSAETRTLTNVKCGVVKLVPFAGGLPQKKGLNPDHHNAINTVNGASCVNQLSSVNLVTNVPTVVPDLPVGARLHQFWKKWAALGISGSSCVNQLSSVNLVTNVPTVLPDLPVGTLN